MMDVCKFLKSSEEFNRLKDVDIFYFNICLLNMVSWLCYLNLINW